MALLRELRDYVLRRRGRPPISVAAPGGADDDLDIGPGQAGGAPLTGTAAGRGLAAIETKPLTLPLPRGRSMNDLQRSYDEVMALIRKIGDHLDEQSGRHKRLQETLDKLPQALEVLPEINRQNARLLDVFGEYLDQSRRRESILNDTLARITESSRQQTEVLGLLRQQLSTNNQSARQISETLGEFRQTLGDLARSNTQAVQVLQGMASASEQRDSRIELVLGRWQRWMIAALLVYGVGSILALGIALAALFLA